MNKKHTARAFTLVEILVGLAVSAAIFVVATSLVVNIFSSSLKSRQSETLEQVKNDLSAELGNNVRWADTMTIGSTLQIESTVYELSDGRIYKDGQPLTPLEVEITKFEVSKHESRAQAAGSGSGLTAQYFNESNFSKLAFARVEPRIDFNWGEGSPDSMVDPNTFSIRFTGQIQTEAREYTFYVASDEGARLWVDGVILVDDWSIPGFAEVSGRVNLSSGKHDIRLDYFDNFGPASVALYWSYPGQTKQIIPTASLFPKLGPVNVVVLVEMRMRNSPTLRDSLKLTLSPRSGNISTVE